MRTRTGMEALMGHVRRTSLMMASLLPLLAVAGACASSSATSSSRPGQVTDGSQPPGSSVPASSPAAGEYVPASGTDSKTGLLFDTYDNAALGYKLFYPGGWNVTRKGTTVRIAKFGNAIVIAERPAKSAPKLKGVQAALKKQEAEGGLLAVTVPARPVSLSAGPAIRVVFTQAREATSTSPAATLLVYRYMLFHDGNVVVLSMQGPQEFDNRAAYKLIAETFAWG
jgi:hypothetical protein